MAITDILYSFNVHKVLHHIYHGHEKNSYQFQVAFVLLIPIICKSNDDYSVLMVSEYMFY